jgi:hypothetical protein
MSELSPFVSTLPGYRSGAIPWEKFPNTTTPYAVKLEPFQDSCDGRPETRGWSQVVVQGVFKWPHDRHSLLVYLDGHLPRFGWNVVKLANPEVGSAYFTKRLTNGTTGRLQFDPVLGAENPPRWMFVAEAPPIGRKVTGC